ncbi:MAG: hypothetical protein NTV00_02760 [Methylococcales bacterium]|nr:hypothetical protein [Methylococcales bacterium]
MKDINNPGWVHPEGYKSDGVTQQSESPQLGYAIANPIYETASKQQVHVIAATYVDDERYPGSFFRIPRAPIPGKTTWSIN